MPLKFEISDIEEMPPDLRAQARQARDYVLWWRGNREIYAVIFDMAIQRIIAENQRTRVRLHSPYDGWEYDRRQVLMLAS